MIDKDYHFELLPSVDAAEGVPFGIGLEMSLNNGGFHPGSTDWATQDTENEQDGTTSFGRDRLLGPVWGWDLHVNREDDIGALETLRPFRAAWHWLDGRRTPGLVTALRYQLNGERRRIYGRPQRFDAPPDNAILSGYVPVTTDFKCVDGFTYSDDESAVTLLLGQGLEEEGADSGGGFVFPLTFPAETLPPTRQIEYVQVGGDAPTYPVIRFWGPVINPGVVTDEWELRFTGNGGLTVPDGQYLDVDLRPWARTALLNGVSSVAGRIAPRTRLADIRFHPGRFEAKYVGYSAGTSECQIRWRSAWNSY